MIYPPFEELLDTAEAAGYTPKEIRLGAIQMREFREWASRSVRRYPFLSSVGL